jgi:hypothetical protein
VPLYFVGMFDSRCLEHLWVSYLAGLDEFSQRR